MLREESGKILRELFEFGELTAREVMTPRVRLAALPLGADADTVTATVRKQPYTRYPVYDGDIDHLTGMVNVKDLLLLKSSGAMLSPDIVRPIPAVPETATLDVVLETLREARAQMAVVIDEHGGTAGVLTHEDLFDEVIGEVAEGAADRTSIYRDAGGVLHVSGTSRVEEAGEALGVTLEHDEVDSVSGLILTLLGRPPRVGDVVTYDHVRFEVVSVEGLGVERMHRRAREPTPGQRDARVARAVRTRRGATSGRAWRMRRRSRQATVCSARPPLKSERRSRRISRPRCRRDFSVWLFTFSTWLASSVDNPWMSRRTIGVR